jgi:signal transduction histidine kinase
MDKKPEDIIALLREVEIFSEINEDILALLANRMKYVVLEKNQLLFKKGDQDNAMYFVIEGSIQVHDGDYIFTTLNSKQFFGEYSLIDLALRSASATAVTETQLLELKEQDFTQVSNAHPQIWKSILKSLTKRLRDYNVIEEKLTLRSIDIQKQKIKAQEEKLNVEAHKKELEQLNRTKDKFFTIIAHDLKNPFSTISMATDNMLTNYESQDDVTRKEYIKQISQNSNSAYNLLENLLQWSRSQTGNLRISFKRTNLLELINSALEVVRAAAHQKQIELSLEVDEGFFAYVDVEMMKTVFRNLVSNSVKYSAENSLIELQAREKEDMLEIVIKDSGEGISDVVKENLFRLDTPQATQGTHGEQGSGLGLVLCKEFVQKNGGEIWVGNTNDKGTTFCFTIPKAL